MQQVLAFYEIERAKALEIIRREARHICYQKGRVTVDDLREALGDLIPAYIDKRIFGAALTGGMFECVGYVKTKVKSSHGRSIGVFRLRRAR